ncbi:MAG: FecR domain-containing protein [Ignavibacteriales bacterium]|nr:FecR domain-containing protein [Ignavibacteriales bacterium]
MSDNQIDWKLLALYFSGESTEARSLIEAWMEGDPLRKGYVESLRSVWRAAGRKGSDWDVDSAWNSVASKAGLGAIGFHPPQELRQSETPWSVRTRSEGRLRSALRLALAATLLAGIPYLVFRFFVPDLNSPDRVSMREVVTEKGERARIRLTDGSTVLLNSASSIRFPERFAENVRELYLQGEAYFNVVPSGGKLFVLRAQNASVEVLGTEFNVRAWPDEPDLQVVVAEGSVAVHAQGEGPAQHIVLTSGEMSNLNEDGTLSPPMPADLSRCLDWVNGKLVFSNAPFHEVIRRLERHYNLRCFVQDTSVSRRHLTASFKDEPTDEIVRIIALTLDLQYKKEGNSFLFSSKRKRTPKRL